MRLNEKYKIEKVASKEPTQYAINAPYLDDGSELISAESKRVIVATNGKALVAVPVETDENDVNGVVPIEALKASRKNGGAMSLNGKAETGGTAYNRPDDVHYPNWKAIIPKAESDPEIVFQIKLNPFELVNIAEAMGLSKTDRDGLILQFRGHDKMVVIRRNNADGIGLLMPMKK